MECGWRKELPGECLDGGGRTTVHLCQDRQLELPFILRFVLWRTLPPLFLSLFNVSMERDASQYAGFRRGGVPRKALL